MRFYKHKFIFSFSPSLSHRQVRFDTVFHNRCYQRDDEEAGTTPDECASTMTFYHHRRNTNRPTRSSGPIVRCALPRISQSRLCLASVAIVHVFGVSVGFGAKVVTSNGYIAWLWLVQPLWSFVGLFAESLNSFIRHHLILDYERRILFLPLRRCNKEKSSIQTRLTTAEDHEVILKQVFNSLTERTRCRRRIVVWWWSLSTSHPTRNQLGLIALHSDHPVSSVCLE